MKEFFTKIHYSKQLSTLETCISALLWCVTPFYWLASELRNILYDTQILTSQKIDGAFVISIGNITTGGVGKTPIVAKVANALSVNYKVGILSRGYGGQLDNTQVNVIKYDNEIKYNSKDAGDEPFWLAQNTNENVCVLTCASRVEAGKYATSVLGCQVLILDDGFQHRQIHRDLDIVVFDAFKLVGNASVLPLGPLREPLFNVKRANKIILTNKNLPEETFDGIVDMTKKQFSKPVIKCGILPKKIYNIKTYEELRNYNDIAAFCAIGQPMLFFQYLKDYKLKYAKSFDDHYSYTQEDADNFVKLAHKHNITAFITTEKDAVKLTDLNFQDIGIYALQLDLNIDMGELISE